MNTVFSLLDINRLYESQHSVEEPETDTSTTSAVGNITRPVLEKLNQPRRSRREFKPSKRLRESTDHRIKKEQLSQNLKSKKVASYKARKRIRYIAKREFLHHYPITNSTIDDFFANLDDQRKALDKLSATEVRELDAAIKKSATTGVFPGVKIISLGDRLGSGAFLLPSAKPLKAGTLLGIYSGEYKVFQIDHLGGADLSYAFELTDIICLDKEEHLSIFGNDDSWTDNGDYVVYCDALEKGNWTRYLNHGGRSANCEAQLVRYPSTGKMGADTEQWLVVVRVLKRINPGEQLLLDYGKNYWKKYDLKPEPVNPKTFTLDSSEQLLSS